MKNFSITEVAEILGISRQAILKKIKKGEIKARLVGHSYIIAKKDLPSPIEGRDLNENDKQIISGAVSKTIDEYGETLKMLGKE